MPFDALKRNNVTLAGQLDAARSIVFVHGFGTDQHAWQAVAAPLMSDFRIVLLDNVGAGGAAAEAFSQHRYLSLNRYATDLLEVCAALKLHDAILVGHSSGAMICALAAISQPALFSRLVLIGASPRYIDDESYRGGFSRSDVDAIYSSISTGPSWADDFAPLAMGNADRPELTAQFAESLKAIPPDRALTVLCSILQSDYRDEIGKLAIPTLIIQTINDHGVPLAVAEFLKRTIPNSQLKIIEADGHLPHISAPEKVLAALRPFLDA